MSPPVLVNLVWKVIARLEGSAAKATDAASLRREAQRRQRLTKLPIARLVTGVPDRRTKVTTSTATLPDGTCLPLRVYRPAGAGEAVLPVVVNFHGGGWVSGDAYQSEWWCSSIAASAGVSVVSVEYRLAPEFPFPTPVHDCYAATEWVAAHAGELRVDAARLAVMGDSAGGNLAAEVCLLARDGHGPRISLQVLIYPGVDFVDDYPSEIENANAPILTKADMVRHRGLYLNGADGGDPLASPLRAASHAGLPPALIQTAHYDPLRDQGAAYAKVLEAAGVQVQLTEYRKSVHGYISVPGLVPEARKARAEVIAALRRVFASAEPSA
ncbi:MAG TPA: alpha/beta hydrolase [Jatrophihabitantaceae bacterium]|jgi:acetyl esterase